LEENEVIKVEHALAFDNTNEEPLFRIGEEISGKTYKNMGEMKADIAKIVSNYFYDEDEIEVILFIYNIVQFKVVRNEQHNDNKQ